MDWRKKKIGENSIRGRGGNPQPLESRIENFLEVSHDPKQCRGLFRKKKESRLFMVTGRDAIGGGKK